MKHITKISALLLAVALLVGVSVSAVEVKNYSENVKVLLNGTDLFAGSTAKPVIINNRCMVPEQPLFSKLSSIQEFPEVGFAKEGVAPYKEFFAAQGGDFSVWLYLNDTKIHAGWSDGKTIDAGTIDVPATTYNGTTYLPLRAFIEKCYGGKVNWDAASRTVSVTVSKEDEGEVWAQAYSNAQSQGATSNVGLPENVGLLVGSFMHNSGTENKRFFIKSIDASSVTFGIAAQTGAGSGTKAAFAYGTAAIKDGICNFKYKDSFSAEGTGTLTFYKNGDVSVELTDTKADMGWSIEVASGMYIQMSEKLPENISQYQEGTISSR